MEPGDEMVEAGFGGGPESIEERKERLRRAGVSIPTGRDMAPFRPAPRRPRWLAFIIRVFRYFFPEPGEASRPGGQR